MNPLGGNGAIEVTDSKELFETIRKYLGDSNFAKTIATNGLEVIRQDQGATEKSVEQILRLLNSR